jgi:hypothetical protein
LIVNAAEMEKWTLACKANDEAPLISLIQGLKSDVINGRRSSRDLLPFFTILRRHRVIFRQDMAAWEFVVIFSAGCREPDFPAYLMEVLSRQAEQLDEFVRSAVISNVAQALSPMSNTSFRFDDEDRRSLGRDLLEGTGRLLAEPSQKSELDSNDLANLQSIRESLSIKLDR